MLEVVRTSGAEAETPAAIGVSGASALQVLNCILWMQALRPTRWIPTIAMLGIRLVLVGCGLVSQR
jgi:hypothetical protein